MKRKRNQCNEETNVNNCNGKKQRIEETEEELCEFDTSISKKEEFVLTREIAHNAILNDISGNQWRIGAPIGKGSFGEIYLASDNVGRPVEINTAPFVTKIEPHSNGPLFVEIHCLLNVNKQHDLQNESVNEESADQVAKVENLGIPKYIASGSHYFNDSRYRFLIMPRYKADLHSIIRNGRLSRKHFLIIASQIIDVLQHLHERHYVHSDIKSENIMIGIYDNDFNATKSFAHHLNTPSTLTNGSARKTSSKVANLSVEFSGANPFRNCRVKEGNAPDRGHHLVYNDMVHTHYSKRPSRAHVSYALDENSRSSHAQDTDLSNNDDSDKDEDYKLGSPKSNKKKRKGRRKALKPQPAVKSTAQSQNKVKRILQMPSAPDNDDHVYLIDYGLATKFVDTNGEHRPFCMDQRRAHDGTLEFTSRDAHFGTHSRRSDLECFGYNLIYWCEGYLPWKDEKLKEQPELVHRLKEVFMTDVKEMLKLLYGKEIEKFIGDYMQYVGQLEFDEEPDYNYLRGLFEKEFLKLGYKKSEMRMNLSELHDECEPIDKSITEHDLMMSRITDLKTVTKLGFLVTTVDNVDGTETLAKPNDSLSLNMSSKASPKNLRSKEKNGLNGSKLLPKQRQRKLAEKQFITEKMAMGKKLSIHEISLLDPDAIARDRCDKEYEKFDDKMQTPQRYVGNPTYAILEIENRLKSKHGVSTNTANEVEPIKGYTKPMMEVLKKQQMAVEQQLTSNSPIIQSRSREGLRNVIKPTQKNLTYQKQQKKKKKSKRKNAKKVVPVAEESVPTQLTVTPVSSLNKPRPRGRPRKIPIVPAFTPQTIHEEPEEEIMQVDEDSRGSSMRTIQKNGIRRGRGRPRKIVEVVAELPETEDDSVYYDIPGEEEEEEENEAESSSDGIKEISDLEMEVDDDDDEIVQNQEPVIDSDDEVLKPKRQRKQFASHSEDNSNHGSTSSCNALRRGRRGRYENDDDFEAFTEEASNASSASHVSKSSVASSFKPRRVRGGTSRDSGIATRNKIKSRSTSRSAAISGDISEHSDQSEVDEGSEFEAAESDVEESEEGIDYDQDDEENVSEDDEEERSDESELDDDSDSIDIKYSPIKTRHARRRINYMSVKQMRRRLPNVMNDNVRNFRLVSTRG